MRTSPVTKRKEDYTRAQWQIDAHGYWRSSGDRLIGKAELMSAPTDRLQKLYREYSRDTVYSYEDHVELARKLDAEGRLPLRSWWLRREAGQTKYGTTSTACARSTRRRASGERRCTSARFNWISLSG